MAILVVVMTDGFTVDDAVPAKAARKQAIADALMKVDPALEVFQFGFEEIAKFLKIAIEEARLRFRHIQLNGPEGGPAFRSCSLMMSLR
jgi:hypothetical protein